LSFAARFLRADNGATAAEFALVLPIFLLTVFSTVYLSMMLGALSAMHAVTEQAARCMSVNKTTCAAANIDAVAKKLYTGPYINGLTFTPSTPACGNTVTGSGTFSLFTGLGKIGVTLSTSACYPNI